MCIYTYACLCVCGVCVSVCLPLCIRVFKVVRSDKQVIRDSSDGCILSLEEFQLQCHSLLLGGQVTEIIVNSWACL